ncbi:MAG TPA: heme o synthase [Oligoflexia bacterium]|nr:heme o synthase [Oligoflexia bacterium]HMP48367.1 heme o synthase [Oligoflexia bacterium]
MKNQHQELISASNLNRFELSFLLLKIRAIYELGKPRVMSLLLIATGCPMILAAGGRIDYFAIIIAVIGGALVSSSASVINCIWDMDIDRLMSRTKNRPLVQGIVSPGFAAVYSFVLGMAGLFLLSKFLNPLASFLALLGHLFYVLIYTMWLKRATPQNIVIGGAAGAVPPLVGWAAMTGKIELQAFMLFLLIFLWTPPHFWALALNKNEDYRLAGIPMLPVVAGERATHLQMLCYSVSLLPVSMLLALSDSHLSMFSLFVFLSAGSYFVWQNYSLLCLGRKLPSPEIEERKVRLAWRIFGFSIVYLSLIFFTIVVDSVFIFRFYQ